MFSKLGLSGVGAFWCLVEMLYEEGGYIKLNQCERIANALRTHCDVVNSVIQDFGLFDVNGEKFYSKSVLRRLEEINIKSEKARLSAKKRWGNNAKALRSVCDGNAIKEIKGNKVNIKLPPTDTEFLESLKTNPAYVGIDIDRVLGKMDAWLSTRPGKHKTRRFVVNWMNRAEKPLETKKPDYGGFSKP